MTARTSSRAFTLTCGLTLLATLAFITSTFGQEKSKTIDLRNRSEAGSQHTIVFAARPAAGASPGHLWVVFGVDDEKTQTCSAAAWGFYPANDFQAVKSLTWGPVKGELKTEAAKKTAGAACSIYVRVNGDVYEKAMKIKRKWDGNPSYQLEKSDCASFVQDVAKSIGLKVPERKSMELPEPYCIRVIEAN